MPGALEEAVAAFVAHYNHRRYHESLGNLTPANRPSGHALDHTSSAALERYKVTTTDITKHAQRQREFGQTAPDNPELLSGYRRNVQSDHSTDSDVRFVSGAHA